MILLLAAGASLLVVLPLIIKGLVEKYRRTQPETLVWDIERGRWVPISRKLK